MHIRQMRPLVLSIAVLGVLWAAPAADAGSPDGDPGGASPEQRSEVLARTDAVTIRQEGNWVRYEHAEALRAAERRTYRGKRLDGGGCAYEGEEVAAVGEVVEEREVAHNARACLMVTERAARPAVEGDATVADSPGAGHTSETEEATPEVAGSDGAGAEASVAATHAAWHQTRYRDPIFITVNGATTNVTWQSDGTCVSNSWGHTTDYTWLTASGWGKNWSETHASRDCAGATTTSNSAFVNGTFCVGGADTHTEYVPNTIRGQADGTYHMTWSASKSGGCSSLLHFNRTHGS